MCHFFGSTWSLFFLVKVDIHLLLKEHSPKKDALNSLSREQVEVQVKKTLT